MCVIGYEARANSMGSSGGGGGGVSGRCPVGVGSVPNVVHGGFMLGPCWVGVGSMRRFVNLCEYL